MNRPSGFLDGPIPIAFAHRGGTGHGPENTMVAFEHAVGLGYTHLETDVQVTADGVLAAFHDDDLARTCGVDRRITDMTWTELSGVRVDGREPIPMLDELFEAFSDVCFNIDCKSDAGVPALAAAITRHRAQARVCVAAFSDRRLRHLRDLLGDAVCTALGPRQIAALRLIGRVPGRGRAAQVPVRRGRITVVDERFVAAAHRNDVQVHVWTIDDPVEMHRLFDMGVDGIMTDRPEVLRDVLIARGAWPGA